jgi:hypothetical protein
MNYCRESLPVFRQCWGMPKSLMSPRGRSKTFEQATLGEGGNPRHS